MIMDPAADSNIEASTETVVTLTTTSAITVIESETKWLSFSPAKMHNLMFRKSHLLMHVFHLTKPRCTLKLCFNLTAGLYLSTMMYCEYQVPPNPILPPNTLGGCCAIIYFTKHPSITPGFGFLHILHAPVDYAPSDYFVTVYDTTNPALATNCCKENYMVSCFNE